jgi:hypothetical protein
LALPALSGVAQLNPQPIDDIPGGEARVCPLDRTRRLRGPVGPVSELHRRARPVDEPVQLEAITADPIRIWGLSAVQLDVVADDVANIRAPYRVSVTATNVTDADPTDAIPLYNFELEFFEGVNYIYQPGQQRIFRAARLEPGESITAELVLIPQINGLLVLSESFVLKKASGEEDDTATISSRTGAVDPAGNRRRRCRQRCPPLVGRRRRRRLRTVDHPRHPR